MRAIFKDRKVAVVPNEEISDFALRSRKKPISISKIVIYAILILFTIWVLAPFAIIIVTSFTGRTEYMMATGYIWWPKEFTLEGYQQLFLQDTMMMQRGDGIPTILLGFINTLWITLIPLVCSLLQSLLVAYCYSKYRFPCKNFLFMLTVSLMFVPLGSFGFVSYMFYQNIGWTEGYNAWLPLIVPGLFASAGTVFFLRPYVDGIGKEIIEAAEIDGMGFWQIFLKVVIPLSKPALIAQFIFGFVGGYNNYAGALMYLNNSPSQMWTLQIALNKIIGEMTLTSYDFNFTCAVALMAMVPLIILYLACQKFFIEGITFGGGKE